MSGAASNGGAATANGAHANGSAGASSGGTGWMFEELFMWHNPGTLQSVGTGLQPTPHYEDVETKRRFNNLVHVSGLAERLTPVRARPATDKEICRVHTPEYLEHLRRLSADASKGCHEVGHHCTMAPGGFEIAALAAGGAVEMVDAALDGRIRNGYALCRPPGHHARPGGGMGFCLLNNVAVAARHALAARGLERVAVVDYDVHHGNGTQEAFWEEPGVLFVSLHQDSNYPIGSGPVTDVGGGAGEGFTVNVPLPPGSGSGAYRAAFDRVVVPALEAFRPQLILVSSGFDACFYDPLACQMCTSEDYRYFAEVLRASAERHCGGRLLFFHEGGYSPMYVPFCGLAVVEALAGARADKTPVVDPVLCDGVAWGYQGLQPWQDAVLRRVEEGPLALLHAKTGAAAAAASPAAQ